MRVFQPTKLIDLIMDSQLFTQHETKDFRRTQTDINLPGPLSMAGSCDFYTVFDQASHELAFCPKNPGPQTDRVLRARTPCEGVGSDPCHGAQGFLGWEEDLSVISSSICSRFSRIFSHSSTVPIRACGVQALDKLPQMIALGICRSISKLCHFWR